ENVKFRTEPRKEVLRDGKHSILVEKNFEIKYELVRSNDAIRTKKFIEKSLLLLSFISLVSSFNPVTLTPIGSENVTALTVIGNKFLFVDSDSGGDEDKDWI
ncbi:12327_t:CDS:2, partial [Ambispora gerdemannii]